jgi:NAD(P)-dependent dehydrogenase (short-subunit alcohol dehydrogenase family)
LELHSKYSHHLCQIFETHYDITDGWFGLPVRWREKIVTSSNLSDVSAPSPRVVVVTGSGSGIGRAIADAFAREGDAVVVIDRDAASAQATADDLRSQGLTATAMTADVSVPSDIEEACDAMLGIYGHIDVLCNNAGIKDFKMDAITLGLDGWSRVMAVNVTAPFLFSRRVLPGMLKRGSGIILNVASICGLVGGRAGVAYTTSKHALVGLTRNIAFAYAETGVRCNALCPGSVETNLDVSSTAAGAPVGEANPRFDLSLSMRPERRGKPMDIARVAVFLASEAGSFVNGQAVVIDGGWLAG